MVAAKGGLSILFVKGVVEVQSEEINNPQLGSEVARGHIASHTERIVLPALEGRFYPRGYQHVHFDIFRMI